MICPVKLESNIHNFKPMIEININGLNGKLGKKDIENWELLDIAEPYHLWFHLDDLPSGHFFLELPDETAIPTKQQIYKSALQCRLYSKHKSSKEPINVIYTQVKNLRKGTKPGQVIIIGKAKYIKV